MFDTVEGMIIGSLVMTFVFIVFLIKVMAR